jgi:cation diffusion facilitator family transporter
VSAGGESKKAIIAALFANLGIAVAKMVAFLVTTSSAMLAESIHSLADTGNQILLLVGGNKAKKAPDPDHQFGYARERYFWAFVVSIILFTLGSLFAIYEGIHKLQHPEPLESVWWAIGVLIFAMLLEGNSFRVAVGEARHIKGDASWWAFIRRSKNPELPVVVLEDSGALVGLVIALIAVSLDAATHNPAFDAWGSIIIGTLLGIIAIVLAVEMKSLLIGEAAAPDTQERIRAAVEGAPTTNSVISLRTQHLGPDELLVALKVEFDTSLTVPELAVAIDDVEVRIRAEVPGARYLFIEPDIRRAAEA